MDTLLVSPFVPPVVEIYCMRGFKYILAFLFFHIRLHVPVIVAPYYDLGCPWKIPGESFGPDQLFHESSMCP